MIHPKWETHRINYECIVPQDIEYVNYSIPYLAFAWMYFASYPLEAIRCSMSTHTTRVVVLSCVLIAVFLPDCEANDTHIIFLLNQLQFSQELTQIDLPSHSRPLFSNWLHSRCVYLSSPFKQRLFFIIIRSPKLDIKYVVGF